MTETQAETQAIEAPTAAKLAQETVDVRYGQAMAIETQDEADAYLEHLITSNMAQTGNDRDRASLVERSNIGYYAGYFSHDIRLRAERLFRCEHPLLGSAENGPITMERAWAAGYNYAKRQMADKLNEMVVRIDGNLA